MPSPELSLVLATVGRVLELARLFESLARQSDGRFEVILVDQNLDDRLVPLVRDYADRLAITHLRSARGLSRARNAGIRMAKGQMVGFPDDDCWYEPDAVSRCLAFFARTPQAFGLSGVSRDALGAESNGRFDREPGPVNRDNVFRRGISYTLFCRTAVARSVGGFDETLGLGSGTAWGSGEETDFVLRCVNEGYLFHFEPSFVVRHPQVAAPSPRDARRRGRAYGRGFVRVLKKHRYSRAFIVQAALRPLLGAAIQLSRRRPGAAALSFWSAVGRIDELRAP